MCKKCEEWKPRTEFHKHSKCKGGINTICKTCRRPISSEQYTKSSIEKRLYDRAKSRAKVLGREFDISIEDIVVPETCPVFGVPMKPNTEYAPSLDRIDSSKGYVKGNIKVISLRANLLKNDATKEELEALLKYICEI